MLIFKIKYVWGNIFQPILSYLCHLTDVKFGCVKKVCINNTLWRRVPPKHERSWMNRNEFPTNFRFVMPTRWYYPCSARSGLLLTLRFQMSWQPRGYLKEQSCTNTFVKSCHLWPARRINIHSEPGA